jgi:tripartite-type tricarboxylate transporter receptor subunit TctC
MTSLRRLAGLVMVLILFSCAANAQTPAEFYRGKTVSLLIGFGVGGDDDLWARNIAKHLGNHIPGRPVVIPQNVTGAAGLLVANRLYVSSPRDGTVVGMVNRGIPFEPLLGGTGTQFDPLQMNWIGSPNSDTTVCGARQDADVKNLQDLYVKELRVGATGSGADTAVYPEFLSALVGLQFKSVRGYQGSHEIQLAMERNEVQGICLAFDSLARGTLFREKRLNILLQAALKPDPRLDGVPSGVDLTRSESQRRALELFFARAAMGRPFVAPPGLPSDRVIALRNAFDETLVDPVFRRDAEVQNLKVDPIGGQQLTDTLIRAYATPPDVVARTIKALGRSK